MLYLSMSHGGLLGYFVENVTPVNLYLPMTDLDNLDG